MRVIFFLRMVTDSPKGSGVLRTSGDIGETVGTTRQSYGPTG